MRWLYQIFMLLLLLPGLLWLAWRGWRQTGKADAWRERLGAAPRFETGCLWLHAASVGEVQAAIPLVNALTKRYPDTPLLITSFTATGRARAETAFENIATVATLPWDSGFFVGRFLKRVKPRALLVLETEIWPCLFTACKRREIPVAIVSARLSHSTMASYQRFNGLLQPALSAINLIAAQSSADAGRYKTLGLQTVEVTGNIKFDISLPSGVREQGEALRMSLFPQRRVWLAASTREGEEEQILAAFRQVHTRFPDTCLIIAPRYPERGDQVETLATRAKWAVARRSRDDSPTIDTAVFILDTLGELGSFYAACDVAFVGGSLVPVGGHNLLEPAALALPVMSGPYTHNAPDIAEQLEAAGGLCRVNNSDELAETVNRLLTDASEREAMGQAALEIIEKNRGAVKASLQALYQANVIRDRY
ncbi:MAG TPA: lipid IV(A) 3-deoxy-D-manno-octulosonic acid transferase [Gammaproteobacteria bacterium]|nr:lipid IV(A) 3-deoxy-D-manno-octulosonic acid transferase [Gammaproteobacteria bacterium]